jgi:PAS domain S-box-containing protein
MAGGNNETLTVAAAALASSEQHIGPAAFIDPKKAGMCGAVLEAAPQTIIAIDDLGRIVLANAMFETMFGYTRAEILGRPLETLIPERHRKDHIAHRSHWASNPGNRPMGVEMNLTALRKDGVEFPVDITLRRTVMPEGSVSVAFITDVTETKRAEAALHESDGRLRLAQQVGRIGTFEWNIQTGVNRWTPELEAMYGLPPGGFAGTQEAWEQLVHPEDRPKLVTHVTEALQADGDFEAEWRVIWPDSTVRWLTGRMRVIRDADSNPQRLIGLNIDITEWKRAEAALRESEERFRTVADDAPVMIWMSGLDKLCTFVNQPWLEFTGRAMEQELGNGWADGIYPEDQDRCLEIYSSSFDARHPFQMEYRLRRADGGYRWILDTGVPRYRHGEFIGFIGSCVDINERRGAEEALRDSERRFRLLFENSIDAVLLTHIDGSIYAANPAARAMFRMTEQEICRAGRAGLVVDDERARAAVETRALTGRVQSEISCVRGDGSGFEAEFTTAVLGADGGAFATIRDITERQRVLASQKLESLGLLASGIAHDFKNVLSAVLAYTYLAAEKLGDLHELNEIQKAAIYGSGIVHQLMIYAGEEGDVLEPVNISETVQEMHGLLKASVSKRSTLVTELRHDVPAVKARAGQIQRIVLNLVINASDATKDARGVIRIATRRAIVDRDLGAKFSKELAPGVYVQLEISDTGGGMSQETQARLFDPFFTTKSAGRGLGLSVVHGIIRSLQGAICVSSELGNGSTFQVLLPSVDTTTQRA